MDKVKRSLFKDWDGLVESLPKDLDESAKEHGALIRQRKIKSGEMLLRAILVYSVVSSLRNTAIWMLGLGLCDMSRQAIEKRILQSSEWLSYLLNELLKQKIDVCIPAASGIKRILLRDASFIARPGSLGIEWKINLSWSPFNQVPAQVTLSDDKTGEGIDENSLEAGDLYLGDRAYGIWKTIEPLLNTLVFFVFRMAYTNLPLLNLDGTTFDILVWLKGINETSDYSEITVMAKNDEQKRPLRLVAGRIPDKKAEEARERVRKQAKKKKREANPDTLFVAGFCILITNLPTEFWSTTLILSLYRVRWQIEWTFRRWKSLCGLDDLPAYPAPIAKPVLLAKLILLFLMQQSLVTLPWSRWWTENDEAPVITSLVQMTIWHINEIVRPTHIVHLILEQPERFRRHLFSSRRQRGRWQLSRSAKLFLDLIPLS